MSFHGVTMVMEDEGWEMRTKGKIRRWNMIIPLWSVVRNGGDALGNDRESGKDDEGDLELNDCEWEGWMWDFDRRGQVERARAESDYMLHRPEREGGLVKPLSSPIHPRMSSAESLSLTPTMTTSFLVPRLRTTIPCHHHHLRRLFFGLHHPSRSPLSIDEGPAR